MRKEGFIRSNSSGSYEPVDGTNTRVRVGSAYSEEFEVKVGVHQGSELSPLLFAIVVDVITENARSVVNELLYADDLVNMSEDKDDLNERFWNWKNALERKDLKVNTIKTKLMVSGSEGKLFKSKIDPCGVCGRRVMVNSGLCTKCGNWVHGKCAKIKRATAKLAMHFVCLKCKGIIEGMMDLIEKLCDEVETVNGFCYLGDTLNASGGCEAAVTANRFPLKTKGKVYHCCVRSAILYGSETWCLKENEKAILRRTERAMVRAMCGQKVVDRKTTEKQKDMLGLKETINWLATVNGVGWYGHVLRRDDDSVLRIALNLEVTGKRKRGQPKKT